MLADPRDRPLPVGVVTFLLTDIEGSTSLFARLGEERYGGLLAVHHKLVRQALATHQGAEVSTQGDAFIAAFDDPAQAIEAAVHAQELLTAHPWPDDAVVRVRMGLHRGPAELSEGRDYLSLTLHQAARVGSAPRGGQVLVTDEVGVFAGTGVELRPVGSYWLKDFIEPVPLQSVGRPGAAYDARPPRAPRADLSNVAAARTSIIGRDKVLEELTALLSTPGLVTLTGPGGVGKTRVAVEVAASAAGAGEEAWLVELAAVGVDEGASGVVATIARTLDVAAPTAESLGRQLSASTMLLVIDNAEHLADDVAAAVGTLLGSAIRLRILVTSREPLTIAGETVVRLPPLRLPQETDGPIAAAGSPAVRLFVERARERNRDYVVNAENVDVVAELCRELDGVPLALELAAARVASLGPRALLDRLRVVGDLPTSGRRGTPGRHRVLSEVLDWSLSLCTDSETALLRRLGVFAGPVGLDAVIEVAGGDGIGADDVVDALAGLAEKSLVTVGNEVELRYNLLVTVRTAALHRLMDAGERSEAILRHAHWVLHELADDQGPVSGARWTRAAPELLIALERARSGDLPPQLFAELMDCDRVALITGQPLLCIRYALALAEIEDIGDLQRGLALMSVGSAHDALGRTDEGTPFIRRGIEHIHADGTNAAALLGARASLSSMLNRTGTVVDPEADALVTEVIAELDLVTADWRVLSLAQNAIGLNHLAHGRLVEARAWFERSKSRPLVAGQDYNLGAASFNVAEIDELTGKPAAAAAGYRDAANILREVGATGAAAQAARQAAVMLLASGDPDRAVESAADAVLDARRARQPGLVAMTLETLAVAADAVGDLERAAAARSEMAEA